MHVAAGRSLRRVHICVRIDPDDTNLFSAIAVYLRETGYRSNRDRVIPAKNQRQLAFGCGRMDQIREIRARLRDLRQVACLFLYDLQTLRLEYLHIPEILNVVAERPYTLVQTCQPERGWSHIHTATARTQVHRCPDYCNTTIPHQGRVRYS